MARTMIGIFTDRGEVEHSLEELEVMGYDPKDISIIMRDQVGSGFTETSGAEKIVEGAATGVTTGGVLGGLAGLLIGVGAIAIPGAGALLIGGPVAAALGLTGVAATTVSGAITGALAGGLVGALVNLGLPEEDAQYYETKIKEGGILLFVPVGVSDEDEVRSVMEEHGAEQVRVINQGRAPMEDVESSRGYAYAHDIDVSKKSRKSRR